MPTIRRRAPIIRGGQAGPSIGQAIGPSMVSAGGGLLQRYKQRRDADQEAQAIEDYLGYKKQYKQAVLEDLNNSIQSEQIDGYSDRVMQTGQDLLGEALASSDRKKRSAYNRKLEQLFNSDIESMTSRAIMDEETNRLKINANRFGRVLQNSATDLDNEDFFNTFFTGEIPQIVLDSMEANGILDTPERRESIMDYYFNEAKDRVLNVSIEDENLYRSILESDKFKEMAGNEYSEISESFERKLNFQKTQLKRAESEAHTELNSSITDTFHRNLNSAEGPEDINKAKEDAMSMIDLAVSRGEMSETNADGMRDYISNQSADDMRQALLPIKQAYKSTLNQFTSNFRSLNELQESISKANKKDLREQLEGQYINQALRMHSDLSIFMSTARNAGLSGEDIDWAEQTLATLENDLSTHISNKTKSPFLRPNIEVGDPNRLGTQMNKILWQMGNGLIDHLDPIQKTALERAIKTRYIEWLSNRAIARNNGERVPDFDVVSRDEGTAQDVAMGIFNQAMFDILPEEGKQAVIQQTEARVKFMDRIEDVYSSTGTKEGFVSMASASGIGESDAGLMYDAITQSREADLEEVGDVRQVPRMGSAAKDAMDKLEQFGIKQVPERISEVVKDVSVAAKDYISEGLDNINISMAIVDYIFGGAPEIKDASGEWRKMSFNEFISRKVAPISGVVDDPSTKVPVERDLDSVRNDSPQGPELTIRDFMRGVENKNNTPETNGYVPMVKGADGKVKSGVTISTGLDLGQRSRKELSAFIDKYYDGTQSEKDLMKNKLGPYTGKKGKMAQQLLEEKPLSVSDDESLKLEDAIMNDTLDKARIRTKEETGLDFDELPQNVQTAIASLIHNMGAHAKIPRTWKAIGNQDWEALENELNNFYANPDSIPKGLINRRRNEASLIGSVPEKKG